jgi:hypothetical protein
MSESIETAVRMVGNLLKYHPTTGDYAQDKLGNNVAYNSPEASCFCYMGATYIVNKVLGIPWAAIDLCCDSVLGKMMHPEAWDQATDEKRAEWADKLANYRMPFSSTRK